MTSDMTKSLKRFIHDENVERAESSGSRIWKYQYNVPGVKLRPKINVVFSKHQGTETTETIVGTVGYVLAIPAYWIDVDEDIAAIYIASYVDAYINKYIINGGSGESSGGACPKPPMPNPPFVPPYPGPPHHHHREPYPPVPPCVPPVSSPIEDNNSMLPDDECENEQISSQGDMSFYSSIPSDDV